MGAGDCERALNGPRAGEGDTASITLSRWTGELVPDDTVEAVAESSSLVPSVCVAAAAS